MDTLNVDVIYNLLKFVSYFELDELLPCFNLADKQKADIKKKIYNSKLTVTKLSHKTEYHLENKLHREDGPALEWSNDDNNYNNTAKQWWLDNGRPCASAFALNKSPSVENYDGYKEWYINGRIYSTDGPAVTYVCAYKAWYLNGRRHRTDGPAVEYANGVKKWYVNGILTKMGRR